MKSSNCSQRESCLAGILGLAVGDALGVPAEFQERDERDKDPVTDMISGYKPAGTWSDDTSMTLATLASLSKTDDIDACMKEFESWLYEGNYTPDGDVFDVGNATRQALYRFHLGTPANECGGTAERDNGNGSLMRILPAAYLAYAEYGESAVGNEAVLDMVHHLSALTHAHPISKMACGIYVTIACSLLSGKSPECAIEAGRTSIEQYYREKEEFRPYCRYFPRISVAGLQACTRDMIRSGGFVVDTLEAALWVLLSSDSYADTVLAAVNLGYDTDTTAAVAGGLAGIVYGLDAIPEKWIKALRGYDDLQSICNEFDEACFCRR